jgi:hypothetical protein
MEHILSWSVWSSKCVHKNQPTHQPASIRVPLQYINQHWFVFHPQISPFPLLFLVYPQISGSFVPSAVRADDATHALLPADNTDAGISNHVYEVSSSSFP